jgi:hypothetical protein
MIDVHPLDVVPLDPRSEVVRLVQHVVLELARPHAAPAADALLDVDQHRPPVIGGFVGLDLVGRARQHVLERRGRRRRHEEHLAANEQELASARIHGRPS